MMAFKVLEVLILANFKPEVSLHNSILTMPPDPYLKWSSHMRLSMTAPAKTSILSYFTYSFTQIGVGSIDKYLTMMSYEIKE